MPYCRRLLGSPYGPPTIQVEDARVICLIPFHDNDVDFTMYDGNDSGFILYFLRNMNASTLHCISSDINVSCYNSQTSNRPVYTVNLIPSGIAPITDNDTSTVILDAAAISNRNPPSIKLRFMINFWILQNWETQRVQATTGDKVAFARNVLEIFNALVSRDMVIGYNSELPCEIINVPVSTAIGDCPPVATIREVVSVNDLYPIINIFLLSYAHLMDDEPLDVGSAGGAYFTHYGLGASGYYFENVAEGPFFYAPLESNNETIPEIRSRVAATNADGSARNEV